MRSYRKYYNEFLSIINRNNIILTYPDVKADPHKVNLLNFDLDRHGLAHYGNTPYNLGDELGKVVIDWMLRNRGGRDVWVEQKKFFLSIGSGVLSSYQDATFWGTGVQRPYPIWRLLFHTRLFRKIDFRAVRGPLTRNYVIKLGHKCPKIYGDPAILMPFIYQPKVVKSHEYAIIPQFATEIKIRQEYPQDFIISMNTNDYSQVIDKIVSCKKVITSSLHGIILAEAYGVPAVWFRGLMEAVDFKYQDYYCSTNRNDIVPALSIEEALLQTPPPLPNLAGLQQNLIDSFPYDLWE